MSVCGIFGWDLGLLDGLSMGSGNDSFLSLEISSLYLFVCVIDPVFFFSSFMST